MKISTTQDEGEGGKNVNLVSGYESELDEKDDYYMFELKDETVDRLHLCMQTEDHTTQHIHMIDASDDPFTPSTIK